MALIDVVKWDDHGDLIVWKYPESELSTATQLIVNESQQAFLFKGGACFDVFGAGRHTLGTANIPLLNHVVNLPFGGTSPFAAEVWFVNQTTALDIKWGTRSPIPLEDPKYEIVVPVRAFGQFGLEIVDGAKVIKKLVGTTPDFSRETLAQHFQGLLISHLKTAVAKAMVQEGIGILELSTQLLVLAEKVQLALEPEFAEYGVKFKSFTIMSLNVPDNDESYVMLKRAKANAARRRVEGISYEQERSFGVMESAARNEGGGVMGGMLGAGMGAGLGVGLGAQAAQTMNHLNTGAAPQDGQPSAATPPPFGASPANPFAAPSPAVTYHIHLNGQQLGPYGLDVLKQGVASGQFNPESMVWKEGMAAWRPAAQVPELAALFGPPPAPASPPPFGSNS